MSDNSCHFGPYRLEKLLGRGGMGEVFRAFDEGHRRLVAVKRLAPHLADDPEFQQRFRREARNVARLRDPHVVPIHNYGEIDGHLYIDMRLVDGGDLEELVRAGGALPADRAVAVIEQIASALDEAHANGLVHRDVKPSNVLLDARVEDFCYLADFGITKAASTERSNSLTGRGTLLGSLAYMAPEQFDGAVTKQSDVYSLTCIFYELLTGSKPYEGEGLPALMHAHMRIAPPRPSARNPAAALFDEVVLAGMAKEAAARFSSAGALARAARTALEAHRSKSTDVPAAGGDHRKAGGIEPAALPWVPPQPIRPAARARDDSATTVPHAKATTDGLPHMADDMGDRSPRHRAAPAAAEPPDFRPARTAGTAHRLLPVAAAVVIILLVAGIWAMTVGGTSSASNGEASGESGPTTPASAPTPSPTPDATTSEAPAPAPPAGGPTYGEAIFTGRTSDGKGIAVAFKGQKAVGYICDNDKIEAWLEGGISGTAIDLHNAKAGAEVQATVQPSFILEGTVTLDDQQLPFSAKFATSKEGLYQSTSSVGGIGDRIGWIVLPNGQQVGIRTENGAHESAPPLNTDTLEADDHGVTVRAEKVSADEKVILK